MRLILVLFLLVFSLSSQAGLKEDFVQAVVKQCKIASADAEKFATPGRSGNVVQFNICAKSPLELDGGCKVLCQKQNASIGGQ